MAPPPARTSGPKMIRTFPPKPNLKALSLARGNGNPEAKGSKSKFKKHSMGGIKSQAFSTVSSTRAQQRSNVKIDGNKDSTDRDASMNKIPRRSKGVDEVVEELIRDANPASMFDLSDCDPAKKGGCGGLGIALEKDRKGSSEKKKSKKFPFFQAFASQDAADRHRIEYHVEHPIRVAIRLEYLMGTSTVYLNDMIYINRLHKAIRKEEERVHKEITAKREGTEKTRVKKLVLEGKMAPPPGMEDLLTHPVFKVNKMLEMMEELETSVKGDFRPQMDDKITTVEPFQDNDTGEYFKSLHQGFDIPINGSPQPEFFNARQFKKATKPSISSGAFYGKKAPSRSIVSRHASRGTLSRASSALDMDTLIEAEHKRESVAGNNYDGDEQAHQSKSLTWAQLQEERQKEEDKKKGEEEKERMREMQNLYPDLVLESDVGLSNEENEEEEEPLYDPDSWNKVVSQGRLNYSSQDEERESAEDFGDDNTPEDSHLPSDGGVGGGCKEDQKTLKYLRKTYKIDGKVKLCNYSPFENDLLTRYIDEAPDVKTLFDNAEEVRQVYERETMVADDFVRELTKRMNA